MMKASGGCPSGASGIVVPGTCTNNAFKGEMIAMGNEIKIAKELGIITEARNILNLNNHSLLAVNLLGLGDRLFRFSVPA